MKLYLLCNIILIYAKTIQKTQHRSNQTNKHYVTTKIITFLLEKTKYINRTHHVELT